MTATHDALAIRAYHIWEGEGRPHGRHEHHWFAAEAAALHAVADVRPAAAAVAAPAAAEAAPAKARVPAKKAAAPKVPAPAKASARKPAPKAPAEAVVAAAALAAPRTTRTGKGARGAH